VGVARQNGGCCECFECFYHFDHFDHFDDYNCSDGFDDGCWGCDGLNFGDRHGDFEGFVGCGGVDMAKIECYSPGGGDYYEKSSYEVGLRCCSDVGSIGE